MDLWTIGFADRLRFPASRASSESGEMLIFAPIPTGITINKGIDVNDSGIGTVAPATALTAIGADIETGRGYTVGTGSGCRTFGGHLSVPPLLPVGAPNQ
jgi:hypothetical protein